MKVRFKTEWAIIAGALVMLLLLLILFGYSHPHSDDYSYHQIREEKGGYAGVAYLFHNNTGRFLSTALIFLCPLDGGYQRFTVLLFASFIVSIFALVYSLFRKVLAPQQTFALGAFVLLVFCSFTPNLHEFCYWLSGEATYLAALTLWIWAIILHLALLQHRFATPVKILTLLNASAIAGTSESGIFLYLFLLSALSLYYKRTSSAVSKRFFCFTAACFTGLVLFVFSAAGSYNRFEQTPFSGNILLALGGGLYASCYWLIHWVLFLVPACILYLSVWGRQLSVWAADVMKVRFFRAKYVLIAGLTFFALCQVVAVWMSGSMPEQRFENVLFFFLLLLCLFASQLWFREQEILFASWNAAAQKRTRVFALLYFAGLLVVLPNNYGKAVLDVCSGSAAGFHRQYLQRIFLLANIDQETVSVNPMRCRPALLYYPDLTCDSTMDDQDIPRLALANYFGKKWIYEYPCSPKANEYSLKDILKQKRREFFPERKQ